MESPLNYQRNKTAPRIRLQLIRDHLVAYDCALITHNLEDIQGIQSICVGYQPEEG